MLQPYAHNQREATYQVTPRLRLHQVKRVETFTLPQLLDPALQREADGTLCAAYQA